MAKQAGREDHDLGFARVTRKKMPNGEIRTRMKLSDGTVTTITEMPVWRLEGGIPWQEGHSHKGLAETYVVLHGGLVFAMRHKRSGQIVWGSLDPGKRTNTATFLPGEEHWILPLPGCVFVTITSGNEVPNPERSNRDWWPAAESGEEHAIRCSAASVLPYLR